jgi:hypothetical protein
MWIPIADGSPYAHPVFIFEHGDSVMAVGDSTAVTALADLMVRG